jgi:hypothetical protein
LVTRTICDRGDAHVDGVPRTGIHRAGVSSRRKSMESATFQKWLAEHGCRFPIGSGRRRVSRPAGRKRRTCCPCERGRTPPPSCDDLGQMSEPGPPPAVPVTRERATPVRRRLGRISGAASAMALGGTIGQWQCLLERSPPATGLRGRSTRKPDPPDARVASSRAHCCRSAQRCPHNRWGHAR